MTAFIFLTASATFATPSSLILKANSLRSDLEIPLKLSIYF